MKFSTAASVLAIVALKGFVSASPLPLWADHDLEVRGEAMDIESEGLWARDFEEYDLATRAYDDEMDFVARDFMNDIEDILFARQASRQAGRVAGQAAKALKKAAKDTADMAAEKVKDAAEQHMEGSKPPVGGRFPPNQPASAKPKPASGGGPSVPKIGAPAKPQPAPSKILAAVGAKQAEHAAQKSAAERGAQAIIAKQKANQGGSAAAAAAAGKGGKGKGKA